MNIEDLEKLRQLGAQLAKLSAANRRYLVFSQAGLRALAATLRQKKARRRRNN